MSALRGTAIVWPPEDYVFFKQCGEITISPDIQTIGFNCLFCPGICLHADTFLQHLQEQHKEEVFKLYENENTMALDSQESPFLAYNFSIVATLNTSEIDLQNTITNTVSTTTNDTCITGGNQIQSEELKENRINLNILMPLEEEEDPSPVNDNLNVVVHEMKNKSNVIATNRDLQNLITLNPCENPAHNITVFNTTTTTAKATFAMPSNDCVSGSSGTFTYSPNDNECEIGDGEDSGIMLAQSPWQSDGSGLSDCMFTEDSSSKSPHTFHHHLSTPDPENEQPSEPTNCCQGKYFKTSAMRKALTDKSLIKYLLQLYKQNEQLWNPKHPAYKYNAPRTVYEQLSQPLLSDKKCSLTGEEIFGIITELRGRFRRELQKFEARKGKHKTRLWYFENMQFLRQTIEEKRKKRYKHKINGTDFNAADAKLTSRQILSYLLNLYRQNECLWNPQHESFKKCNKQEVYRKISQQLKEDINIDMTEIECLNEVQKLCTRYRKQLRTFNKLKGLYTPNLWCFDEMEFLKPVWEEKIANKISKSLSPRTKRNQGFHKSSEIKFHNLEQQLNFIEIYRSFNALWDVDHPDYRSTNYRRKALMDMLQKINATFAAAENLFELEQLEKTLYLLGKQFSNEKYKRLTKNYVTKDSKMSFIVYEKLYEFLNINVGPFRCDHCQRLCKTYDQYKIHKSTHDGTLPFICTLCGKGFQVPGNLTIHIRRHRRDFPYSCEVCTKSFATSTEVNIHMRSHTGERPYACESCNKTFKTWSFYDLHKRIHLNKSNFHCPICDKAFYERNRFTDHMNIHLNIRKHACHQCGKGFTTVGNLRKHLDLHAAIKKYKCLPCGKSFAQLASLRWHRKTQHNH